MSEVLASLAEDVKEINRRLVDAKELVSAMREAGEETAALELTIQDLDRRKGRWERMLKARGIEV